MFKICVKDEIPSQQARSFDTPLGNIVIAEKDGNYFAYKNSCPHLGINLEFLDQEFMDSDNTYIICANHGALFGVEDGVCVAGPCINDALEKIDISLQADNHIYLVGAY